MATALGGIRVIDAATLGAAPLAAALMAEFGAEVIKVEDPCGGDPLRRWGPQKDDIGLMWKSIARNKKSVTLNLRVPEGQELFRRLIEQSDVLIVNFRPGTLERWGLDHQSLRALNPKLVILHVSGFGLTGPYASRPGFGTLAEAMSGFAHITGEEGGPPTLPRVMLADGVASLTAAFAVMFALYHRDVHGASGQVVDVSLIEPLMRLLEPMFIDYDQTGNVWTRMGNRWNVTVPRNTYRTRDEQWVALSGSAPSVVARLFEAIGRKDLVGAKGFEGAQDRLARADEIDALVAKWIGERDLADVLATFHRHEVAAAPVYDVVGVLTDEHVVARGVFERVDDSELGSMLMQSPIPRLSDTPGTIEHLGPALGAHNLEIYGALLGLTQDECDALKVRKVI